MTAIAASPVKQRIASIDILRGAIMLIMAIDHARDYFHLGIPDATNLAITTPFLFFTRFITHFCAPTFVFLSGISACLVGTRRTKRQQSSYLIKRGIWLIFAEFVIINFAMTLDVGYHTQVFQVIWAIGGSMIILGLLVYAPLPVIGIIGAIIFFGHNILDIINVGPVGQTLWFKLILSSNGFGNWWPYGPGRNLILAYALLPWTGVMLIGYVFGSLYQKQVDVFRRQKVLFFTGLGLLLLFVILRTFNIYGDPASWSVQKTTALTIISFLNVSKYPCSLLYLCLTLGVSTIVLAFTEKVSNKVTSILMVYGNVPFFYYVCHWYLLRIISLIAFPLQGFKLKDVVSFDPPATFGYSLGGVYLIWLCVIVVLYFPCRWFGKYKKTHTHWWLSYL